MITADITLLPHKKKLRAAIGTTLLDVLRLSEEEVESPCNGKGTCGKCRIRVIEGDFGQAHADEYRHLGAKQIAAGVRLACRCAIAGEGIVSSLDGTNTIHRILSDGIRPDIALSPDIRKLFIEPVSSSLDYFERLRQMLDCTTPPLPSLELLRRIPGILHGTQAGSTALLADGELLGIEPGDTTSNVYGVAVDLGTTTLVAALLDLLTGEELATASTVNPQKQFGLDVLTRIQQVKENPSSLVDFSDLVGGALSSLIVEVCASADVEPETVYEVAVAGNSAMIHLFLGVDPSGLGSYPYLPVFTAAVTVPARELSIPVSAFGSVYCLPSVSGYIGGDIVAGLLAAGLPHEGERSLLVDIGTNGEIVLVADGEMFACSCAAGPALEGMNISCGMRAAEGAIDSVRIGEDVEIGTIGNGPAMGICGSGIIDAVAELLRIGAVDGSGRFMKFAGDEFPVPWHSRLRREGGSRFVLHEAGDGGEIAITQRDVRQVQLAKGAILSAILALTARLGIGLSTIDRIYLAGAFGYHVRQESLARLGIIPDECIDRVVVLGNSSKSGAVLTLLSKEKRNEAALLADRVRYIELSCYPGYDRLYADCLAFGASKQ